MNRSEFRNPAPEFRAATLWMLNDRLEVDELRRQLREIHDKGIGAVIPRTFMGLRTEYLSEEWMRAMETIVELTGELGIEVFFQAGYMPGAIPDQDPDSAHVAIASIPRDQEPNAGEVTVSEDENFRYVRAPRIHVLDMFDPEVVTHYLEDAYERTWFGRFGDQFGRTISSVWVDEPHFNPPHLPWGEVLKEEFEADWGYRIEAHVPALFTPTGDHERIRHHYWRSVTGLLLDGYFDQVSAWCERHGVGFSGHLMGEDTLAAQIAFTGACMPLYEKMQVPGIDHLTMSLHWTHWHRDLEGATHRFVMTPKQCSSAAHQLGRRRILAEMYAVSSEGITFEDRKQIADWFFLLGINYRCLHGSFYSMRGRRKRLYVPHLSYQQPWWEDNGLIADYCNRVSYALHRGRFCADVLVVHPVESAYCRFSATGGTVEDPQGKIGADLEEMNESFAGLSERLMRIHRGFEYGDETLIARHGRVSGAAIEIGQMRYRVVVLPDLITLRRSTIELLTDFLDGGGTVLATGALPTRIDGKTSEAIRTLTDRFTRVPRWSGAAIRSPSNPNLHFSVRRIWRPYPHPDQTVLRHSDTLTKLRLGLGSGSGLGGARNGIPQLAITEEKALAEALAKACPPRLRVDPVDGDAADVFLHERELDDGRVMVFLANTSRTNPVTVRLAARGRFGVERWNAETGEVSEAGAVVREDLTEVPLDFAPLQSHLLVLDPERSPASAPHPPPVREEVEEIGSWSLARHAPNALTLDYARLKRGDGEFGDVLPIIAMQEILQEKECYAGPITLRCEFDVEEPPARLAVAVEDAHQFDITLNGREVAYEGMDYYVDRSLLPVDLTPHVSAGTNTLELTTGFQPLEQPEFMLDRLFANVPGTEIESVYLIGDFAVRGQLSSRAQREESVRYGPDFVLTTEPSTTNGDLVASGYPFFAGEMELTAEFELDGKKADGILLRLPGLEACVAEVIVNGRSAGRLGWKPFEVDVTDLVVNGRNGVKLRLKNTLRNLLGPHHRPMVERQQNWGWHAYEGAFCEETGARYPRWYEDRSEDTDAWTEDYFFVPFGLDGPAEVVVLRR